jgi:hypothetical protein
MYPKQTRPQALRSVITKLQNMGVNVSSNVIQQLAQNAAPQSDSSVQPAIVQSTNRGMANRTRAATRKASNLKHNASLNAGTTRKRFGIQRMPKFQIRSKPGASLASGYKPLESSGSSSSSGSNSSSNNKFWLSNVNSNNLHNSLLPSGSNSSSNNLYQPLLPSASSSSSGSNYSSNAAAAANPFNAFNAAQLATAAAPAANPFNLFNAAQQPAAAAAANPFNAFNAAQLATAAATAAAPAANPFNLFNAAQQPAAAPAANPFNLFNAAQKPAAAAAAAAAPAAGQTNKLASSGARSRRRAGEPPEYEGLGGGKRKTYKKRAMRKNKSRKH